MNIGYSFWGFLGDKKYDSLGGEISTPDGNAFYSWSIISELQRKGHSVFNLMPDRDYPGYVLNGKKLFDSWLSYQRNCIYNRLNPDLQLCVGNWKQRAEDLKCLDYVLLEWRFEIPGRNSLHEEIDSNWQPDYFIQDKILKICKKDEVKVVVFDLDYKLTLEDIKKYDIKYIIELGNKWSKMKQTKPQILNGVSIKKVYIPFDFNHIDYFDIVFPQDNLVYVGNRYERDWCIDKYIPEDLEKVTVYGNWKESNRDSEERWPKINFGKRLQTSEMRDVYCKSTATILLAKEEYCKQGFMTARLIEAIFYGTVPFFIEEFGKETIKTYTGKYYDFLTVSSKDDLKNKIAQLNASPVLRWEIIKYLRMFLRFMDVKYFVNDIHNLLEVEKCNWTLKEN